jgi:hypothetical protein
MSNIPAFKPNYNYVNIGSVVGKIVYMNTMEKKETGETFGYDYLIHAAGFGSVNVKVSKAEVYQYNNENYDVNDKPRVRINMTKIQQYVNNQQNVLTNAMTFSNFEEPKDHLGKDMPDAIKGRVGGEVFWKGNDQEGNLLLALAVYSTKKDGSLLTNRDGKPYDPEILRLVVVDDNLKQTASQLNLGDNVHFGYYFINKDDITYDEFGFPTGDSTGNKIERIEVKKIMVMSGQAQQQSPPPIDPFAGQGQQMGPNSQDAQTANNAFGNGNTQQSPPHQQGNPFTNPPNGGQGFGGFGQ